MSHYPTTSLAAQLFLVGKNLNSICDFYCRSRCYRLAAFPPNAVNAPLHFAEKWTTCVDSPSTKPVKICNNHKRDCQIWSVFVVWVAGWPWSQLNEAGSVYPVTAGNMHLPPSYCHLHHSAGLRGFRDIRCVADGGVSASGNQRGLCRWMPELYFPTLNQNTGCVPSHWPHLDFLINKPRRGTRDNKAPGSKMSLCLSFSSWHSWTAHASERLMRGRINHLFLFQAWCAPSCCH